MPIITINGTPIDFPDSGESPNWSESVILFATEVESALNNVVAQYDIPPQTFPISTGATTLTNVVFSPAQVTGIVLFYTIYRKTTGAGAVELTEQGEVEFNYNASRSVGEKWEITNMHASDAFVSFSITDLGVITCNAEAISGTPGIDDFISFRAIVNITPTI